jgi:hypothetical protein
MRRRSALEEQLIELAARVARLEERLGSRPETPLRAARVRRPEPEQPRDYWLRRCEGFVVDSPEGEVGVVDGLRFLSRHDRPDELEVRSGHILPHLLVVPVDEVEAVSAEARQVVLRRTPASRRVRRVVRDLSLRALSTLHIAHF